MKRRKKHHAPFEYWLPAALVGLAIVLAAGAAVHIVRDITGREVSTPIAQQQVDYSRAGCASQVGSKSIPSPAPKVAKAHRPDFSAADLLNKLEFEGKLRP